MGFLQNRVQNKAQRLIAPYAQVDEEILLYELVRDERGSLIRGVRSTDQRLGVVATTRALYFDKNKMLMVIPYPSIAYVSAPSNPLFGNHVELVTQDQVTIHMEVYGQSRELGRIIQERLLRLEPYDESKMIGGAQVRIHFCPWRPDTMSYWSVDVNEDPTIQTSTNLTPADIEIQLSTFREQGEREVFDRARRDLISVPEWELDRDWLGRDWSNELTSLLHHNHQSGNLDWAAGYHVGSSSATPTIIAIGAQAVCLASFESMRPLMLADRSPQLSVYPYSRIADWEVRPQETEGGELVRLLRLLADPSLETTLEEIVKSRNGFELLLLGFPESARSSNAVSTLVDQIKTHGAFTPADREFHPLQP